MKYFYMICINISVFMCLSISVLEAQSLPFISKDIIVLPHETTPTLAQLQMNCARYSAQLAYLKAEKNCTLFWKTLKDQEEKGATISNIKMCGFYVGLLNERVKYETQTIRHQSLTQMVNSISAHPDPLPSTQDQEEDMLTLLKTFDIHVNIKHFCKKAAYQKSGYAMEILGDYYENTFDYEEAIYWYRRAIEMYHITPQNGGITATYALGSLFALAPTQTLRQPRKAAAFILQSVALGDDSFIASYLTNKNCKNCLPLATRLQIQTLLKQQNLYAGYLDGDFGAQTIKAIMMLYQQPQHYSKEIQHFQQQTEHTVSKPKELKTAIKTRLKRQKTLKFYPKFPKKTATIKSEDLPSWLTE